MKYTLIDIKWLFWGLVVVAILGFLAGLAFGESSFTRTPSAFPVPNAFPPAAIILVALLMVLAMNKLIGEIKIAKRIILNVPIFMMNNFLLFKFSPKMLFHNIAMFSNPINPLFAGIINFYKNISRRINSFATERIFKKIKIFMILSSAFFGTTFNFIKITLLDFKGFFTNHTLNCNAPSFPQMATFIRTIGSLAIFCAKINNLFFVYPKWFFTNFTNSFYKTAFTHIAIIFFIFIMSSIANGESYIYAQISKNVNGSYVYYLPKLELNQQKLTGKLFNQKCYFLNEFSGELIYSAPRENANLINHSAIGIDWAWGVEMGPLWATTSLGGLYRIGGNNEGLPAGWELNNSFRFGLCWK